jgi:competence protein ComEC
MQYICSYFIVIFTIQLIFILRQASSLWLLALWSFLFFMIFIFRKKLAYPQDHPHVQARQYIIIITLMCLLLLSLSHLFFYTYVQNHKDSVITEQLQPAEKVGHGDQNLQKENQEREPVKALLSGKITSTVESDGDRIRFDLKVGRVNEEKLGRQETVRVSRYINDLDEKMSFEALAKGDYWEGFVQLTVPSQARNPGAFDYKEYLYQKHIHYVGTITDAKWTYAHDSSWKGKFTYFLDRQRHVWMNQVERIFSDQTAPIVQAMTVGYRSELDQQLMVMYQELGIIHILAISGLHVGIMLWALYWGLSRFPLTRESILTIMFLFIPFYMYISGAQISVVRAGLMGMIAIICLRYNLWKHSLLALYAVYMMILFYNPYALYHIGFQLSFLVTFALIIAYHPVFRLFSKLGWPEWVGQIVGVSLIAQLASLPIILYHFYQFSPFSLLINILLVPLYSIVYIPGAFFITLLSFIHIDVLQLAIFVYESTLHFLHEMLHWVHSFSFSTIHVGKPSSWWLTLYFLLFLTWLIQLEIKRWMRSWLVLLLLMVLVPLQIMLPYVDQEAKIMLLDVGQGEAIIIELPYRKEILLIDVGGQFQIPKEDWKKRSREFEVGRDILLPYLRYRGINQIDKIIVSHGHYDHFGGIQGILGQVKIGKVLRSPIPPHSEYEKDMLKKLNDHSIPVYGLGQGDHWGTKQVNFQVLFPKKQDKPIESISNLHDYNIVLWNKIYQTVFLWTGDIEEMGEQKILNHYPQLKADILKVAHHGSNTSTSGGWVQQLEPKAALLSLGINNRHGHPHTNVVQRLEDMGTTMYRTDVHGGVLIKVSPKSVIIFPTLQETGQGIK